MHEVQNTGNPTAFRMWPDDKLREINTINNFFRLLDSHISGKMNSDMSHATVSLKSTAVVIFKFHKVV